MQLPHTIPQPAALAAAPILLRYREAAAALGLCESKVRELAEAGDLPIVRIGRAVRINRAALERWADEHTEPAPAPIRGRR